MTFIRKVTTSVLAFGLLWSCNVPVCSAEEAEAAGEDAAASPQDDEEKAQQFVDSAKELQDKLGQLKELLAMKGEGADDDMKERLQNLEKQLDSLGLDSLTGAMSGNDYGPELGNFLGACVGMVMKRMGPRKPTTTGALRRLAQEGFTREQAKEIEFGRMVAVCISDLTDQELKQYKSGSLKVLPQAMADTAAKLDSKSYLDNIEDVIWVELKKVCQGLVKELGGDDVSQPASNFFGLLALVPILGAAGFLTKKFMDMQKEAETQKSNKKSKKQK